MSRRRKVYKKEEKLDSRYGSPAVARLISTVMKRGKKSLAERIVYTAIDKSREGSDAVDPLEIENNAHENDRHRHEEKTRRVGGATYQMPMEVTPARQRKNDPETTSLTDLAFDGDGSVMGFNNVLHQR